MKKPIPFGKYYLLERINVGGMAEVFRAKAYGVEGFERLVAVKRILPNIAEDKEFISMFIDEAKIAVQLNHANIAQIFDLGMVDSSYYIALEHIHGRDLRAIFDRCRENGQPMPIAQAAFIIMKVCEGLDYAHNKRDQSGRELNLVHRDVSPQNVLVSFEGEVKLIDFGIAKAAGKGAKTQAGILKGKFGYMSPEQVRGLPIDRRTDIFSCGIVLYELLTGERLFFGESDFSTLEKVRNVEILPPSTYNRKIPDELERIVLKALAKDVEDRYLNAIDLHDDLQAFVYTAGEFYSRKDLASWMKDTFVREIEEETAKLESYRQLRPPEMRTPSARRANPQPTSAARRSTLAMPSVATKPPPIPPAEVRISDGMAALAPSDDDPASLGPHDRTALTERGQIWDEDELDTQIYGSADELKAKERPASAQPVHAAHAGVDATVPLGSMAGSGESFAPAEALPSPGASASKIPTARGWDSGVQRPVSPPARFPAGSNQSPSPFADGEESGFGAPIRDDGQLLSPFDVIAPGESVLMPKKPFRTGLYIGIAAAAALLVGGGVAGYFLVRDNDSGQAVAATAETAQNTQVSPSTQTPSVEPIATTPLTELSSEVLAQTGFNLIVEPKDAKVELDGEVLKLTPPMKVRNIQPGEHELVINGPPGFFSKNQKVTVEAGKAETLTIKLDPLEIAATFASAPPDADVTLIINGAHELPLGKTPTKYRLDPRESYQVRFEKPGYATKIEAVSISGRSEEQINVVLERAPKSRPSGGESKIVKNNQTDAKTNPDGQKNGQQTTTTAGADSGTGILAIGSKPPCQIFIDGKDTGKKTPERNLVLPAGRHRVMLVNEEFGIQETFSVVIKSGETEKVLRDYSDRMQK